MHPDSAPEQHSSSSSSEHQYGSLPDNKYAPIEVRMKRVTFGRRLGAYLMDGLYITILSVLLYFAVERWNPTYIERIGSVEEFNLSTDDDSDDAEREAQMESAKELAQKMIVVVFFSTFIVLPYSMMELRTGVSPGKYVLGIAVAESFGYRASQRLLLKRWAVKNAGTLLGTVGIVTGLGVIDTLATLASIGVIAGCFLVLTPERMTLHDMLSGTAVFRKHDVEDSPSNE